MEGPPLNLSLRRLSPHSLFLSDPEDPPSPSPVPQDAVTIDEAPPALSSTHNYPGPYPAASLGANLSILLELKNVSHEPVSGVRMMCEVQSPGGRNRLGEVVHGEKEETSDEKSRTEEGEADGEGKEEREKEKEVSASVAPAAMPELPKDDSVKLEVSSEIKELGMHVIICSVAWETPDGRRTLQRFLKFNVIPPLAIKTRIFSSSNPNITLDAISREEVFLEVLMQNVFLEAILFDKVYLETVHGLQNKPLTDDEKHSGGSLTKETSEDTQISLMPGDTTQQLFKLAPSASTSQADKSESVSGSTLPKSSFPPSYPPGSILPLGRLDLSWKSGMTHDQGRLQTSTLNRRIPQMPNPAMPPPPTRTASAAPPSPAQSISTRLDSPRPRQTNIAPNGPPVPPKPELGWEYDLTVQGDREVDVENEVSFKIKIGVRSAVIDPEIEDPSTPEPLFLAFQYLSEPPPLPSLPPAISRGPSPPPIHPSQSPSGSRVPTPQLSRPPTVPPLGQTSTSSGQPYSNTHTPNPSSLSRPFPRQSASFSQPMTPVSSQLRQATSQAMSSQSTSSITLQPLPPAPEPIVSFPPPPYLSAKAPEPPNRPSSALGRKEVISEAASTLLGRVQYLGSSLKILSWTEWKLVEERMGTTYADPISPPRRWEAILETEVRFLALEEGLTALGGARVLFLEDESGLEGHAAKEWESLGDVWVAY